MNNMTKLMIIIISELLRKPLEGKEFEGENRKFGYVWMCISKIIDELHINNHSRCIPFEIWVQIF